MSLELLGRINKELSVTGSALYEALLAISERVNRKVQIIRLHWQASTLLERMDRVTGEVGQEMVDLVSRRFLLKTQTDAGLTSLEALLNRAATRVHDLKRSLLRIDTQIRELKVEAIHHDLLRLQRDLALRSAGIERLMINRSARAVGQPVAACPLASSVHIATILRGPFLLAPSHDLVFRPDDIVVLIGLQADLDELTPWFTDSRVLTAPASAGG